MLKETRTYKDLNGNDVTDDFYFNLMPAEIARLEMSTDKAVGLEATILALQEEKNSEKIYAMFEKMIRMSIGRKSADGKRFIKSDEIADEFMQTNAYSDMIIEFFQDPQKGAEFFKKVVTIPEQKPAVPAPPVTPIR